MTEKRFYIDLDIEELVDRKEEFPSLCFTDSVDWYTLCQKLNELNEEAETCKTTNRMFASSNNRLRNTINRLHREIDKLWNICRDKNMTDEEIIKELER